MASRTSTDPLEILLEMGVNLDDLSEQDYLGALMEAIATIEFQTKGKGDARSVALRKEVAKERKRRRENPDPDVFFGNKPDYIQEKRKKISVNSFKKRSATGTNVAPKALPTSAIVPYQAPEAEEEGEEKKKRKKKPKEKNLLADIAKSVVKIADILKEQYGVKKKSAEFDRKKAEQEKRALQKSKLSKGFEALVKGAQKVIAPVQSLLSRVFGFLFNLLLGKFVMKLLDWIGNPKNREKFNSVVRFLKDNWPKLIALYLVFGNSIGKFIFNLTKTLIGGAVKLTIAIAKLMAAKKIKGARGVARFLGKRGGLIGAGVATALTVGGAMAVTNAVAGGGEGQQTQAYSGGGYVKPAPEMQPLPKKVTQERKKAKEKSGPLGFISGMSGAQKGMALGAMFGPLGMLAGAGIGSLFDNFGKNKEDKVKLSKPSEVTLEVPAESVDGGQVDGPGGIDKVPAMLTDGEFVMSRGAVQKIGVDKLEAMNAAGGGTNKPKVVDNKVFAYGGGMIGMKRGSGFGSPVGNYPPDKDRREEKPKSSGKGSITPSAGSSTNMESLVEKIVDRKLARGQGGRVLGSTTQRGGMSVSAPMTEVEKIKAASQARLDKLSYGGRGKEIGMSASGNRIIRSKGKRFDAEEKARRKEIQDRGGFLGQLNRSFTGMFDVLSGGESRYEEADKASTARVKQAGAAAIGRYYSSSDGKYYKDYNAAVKAREKRLTALKTSQATTKTLAKKRHDELMKSTDQKKIADYDAKHGAGAYSKKLQEKLNKIYSPKKAKQMTTGKVKPTGKVVGRENLPPATQKLLERMDAQRAGTLPPDIKTSGPLLGRMAMGMGGGLNLSSGVNNPKSFIELMGGTVKDGNIGKPTAQEQKDFDALAKSKANLAQSQKRLAALQPPTPPSNNVQVIKSDGSKGGGESQQSSNGSELPAINAGNGNKSKFTLLGISF